MLHCLNHENVDSGQDDGKASTSTTEVNTDVCARDDRWNSCVSGGVGRRWVVRRHGGSWKDGGSSSGSFAVCLGDDVGHSGGFQSVNITQDGRSDSRRGGRGRSIAGDGDGDDRWGDGPLHGLGAGDGYLVGRWPQVRNDDGGEGRDLRSGDAGAVLGASRRSLDSDGDSDGGTFSFGADIVRGGSRSDGGGPGGGPGQGGVHGRGAPDGVDGGESSLGPWLLVNCVGNGVKFDTYETGTLTPVGISDSEALSPRR